MDTKRIIKTALQKLQIEKLRKHQQTPINSILSGKDTFVISPTGSGKSAIYQIPAILHPDKPTLVIEPTISLMHDQVQKLKSLGIAAEYLDSTQTKKERQSILDQFQFGKVNILYMTPERLHSESFSCAMKNIRLFMVVIDEAHCVMDWGYTFRDAYLHIGDFVNSLDHRPVIAAFTATASPKDAENICAALYMKHPEIFRNNLYRKNLTYLKKYADDRSKKQQLLMKYLRKYHCHSSVIYCNTRRAVDAVCEFLQEKDPGEAVKCHADLSPKKRAEHELQFLTGEKSIMVATTAFGMGVDLGSIDLVIHFNMPLSLTDYMQQTGRAGRDGQKAHCILLYSDEDYYTNQVILSGILSQKAEKHALKQLDLMKEFCDDTERCMAQLLLEHFGQHRADTCNHCTTCQKKRRTTK